jgi:hypothetical protein
MRRAGGYAQIIDPDRPLAEYDTISCAHCGTVVFTKPNTLSTTFLIQRFIDGLFRWVEEPGAGCRLCMKPICLRCHDKGSCTPLEKWLETMETAGRRLLTLCVLILLFAAPAAAQQTAAQVCAGPPATTIRAGETHPVCWNAQVSVTMDDAPTSFKVRLNGVEVPLTAIVIDPIDGNNQISAYVPVLFATVGTVTIDIVAVNPLGEGISDPFVQAVSKPQGPPAKPSKPKVVR